MVNREVSSAEDMKGGEFMNVKVDREHFVKLLILCALWRRGPPARMVEDLVDDLWTQLDEFVADDLTLEDFEGLRVYMEQEA